MSFKIPTWGDGIGALVGSAPRIIKWFKDRGRINEVKKIDSSVDSGNDKLINDELRNIVSDSEKRRAADS